MSTLTFAINDNNDLYLDQNDNIAMHSDLLAVQDACLGAARTILGEMLFYINQGLPDFQAVWDGVPDLQQFETALRFTLLNVQDVDQVLSISVDVQNNILTYSAIILTIYGQTEINDRYEENG